MVPVLLCLCYAVTVKQSRSIGGVVISREGKILVVSQHGTSWSLIKGTVEPGEDDKATALREFKEESGITKVKFIKNLGTYERHKIAEDGSEDKLELKTITIYLCTTPELILKPETPITRRLYGLIQKKSRTC